VANGVTFRTHPETLVITGTDVNHVIVTEPLVEVFPPEDGVPVVLRLAFEGIEGGEMGIEGGIPFVSAHPPDGSVVLDVMVDLGGESVEIPEGEYTLRLYFRSCDGNCGLLDPPNDWCTVEDTFVAGVEYDITVTVNGYASADCTLQEAPGS
jgi:hypothetical protein